MKFAVVDLETTGGTPADGRIMEVGIALMDDEEVVETFHYLIDPCQPIQPFVQNLTGIKDEDVAGQPPFSHFAEEIAGHLEGRIFVAHNVQYDYRFLQAELKRCLITFNPPRLCTVKLSRKCYPMAPSHSLYKLTEFLGLPDFNHHRALDDTLAAAELLKLALKDKGADFVRKEVKNIPKSGPDAIRWAAALQ